MSVDIQAKAKPINVEELTIYDANISELYCLSNSDFSNKRAVCSELKSRIDDNLEAMSRLFFNYGIFEGEGLDDLKARTLDLYKTAAYVEKHGEWALKEATEIMESDMRLD